MKIVWTEPAVEDLRELHAYIARDSEMYAGAFVERIILAAERVADYPKIGRAVPETNDKSVREILFQRYVSFIALRTIVLKCCQSFTARGPCRTEKGPRGNWLVCGWK